MRFEYKTIPPAELPAEIKRVKELHVGKCLNCEEQRKKYLSFLKSQLPSKVNKFVGWH